ncbi:MAG: type VI secretion system tip protein VgrG [Polyangiaceae bacterium]|nr:type VI secretion system tip protein VgrG [Polyangiaceae bacterium]
MLEVVFEGASDTLFSVRRARLEFALGRPFTASLLVRSSDDNADLRGLLGTRARLVATPPVADAFEWSGVCVGARLEEAEATGLSTYELTIVPSVWLLSQRSSCRVFQRLTAPAIAQRILAEWGIASIADLAPGDHAMLDYRVQYNETDLAFMSRILEEAGITYTALPASAGRSLVRLEDNPGHGVPAGPPIPFYADSTTTGDLPFATSVHRSERLGSDAVTLRDYDFRNPRFDLSGRAELSKSRLERYEHVPGAAVIVKGPPLPAMQHDRGEVRADVAALQRLAERSLDSLRVDRTKVSFVTNQVQYAPGDVVALSGHPRRDIGDGSPLLVVGSVLEFSTPGDWRGTYTAFPATERFRPRRDTPKPRIHGVQTAMVVGPGTEEIHTDELGRIRVLFAWDREGRRDDQSSCWVRVSQSWAGAGFGAFALPRVGDEVLVSFLDGDPDDPVVVGMLHNGARQPPFRLPEEKALSGICTRSTPGTEGYNELRFDDRAGEETLSLRAQRNLESVVVQDRIDRTGRDLATLVGGASSTTIDGEEIQRIGGGRSLTVGGPVAEQISGPTLRTQGPRSTTVTGSDHLAVTESSATKIGGSFRIIAGTAAPSDAVFQASGAARIAGATRVVLVSGKAIELACGSSRLSLTPDKIVLKSKEVVIEGEDEVTLKKGDATLVLDGKLAVGASEIALATDSSLLSLATAAELKGSKIKLVSTSSATRSSQTSDEQKGQARFQITRPDGHDGPLTLVIAAPDGSILEKPVQPGEDVSLEGYDGEHFELIEIRAGDMRLAHDLEED